MKDIVNVLNEANEALNNRNRTTSNSPIGNELACVATGGGLIGGAALSISAILAGGTSAAGITSGLAALGGGAVAVGGYGMVGGLAIAGAIFVAPAVILGGGTLYFLNKKRERQLKEEKKSLLEGCKVTLTAIKTALEQEKDATKERIELLIGFKILLQRYIDNLESDLKEA
ncbi:hypothetical protein Barb4_01025 [Bacteroidales bacterium Barb4]|nr:hypothetical protein Barb4_01025 [Bacteroidales bacterium Barb4]